ncbi:Serine/threonine-protein kinase ATM [Galdieria sulphuraria]|nr:Serine/threonine-protein kinase ATM [Galdieria sulphuraria]
MECRNDSIEVVTRSFPQREHFWSQLFSIQKPFRKEGTKFSEKAVASSLTVFVAELDKLISTRRSAYVNVKLSYFFAELLRQVTCNLENAMNLSSLKETAQNFFLEILASFESVVSVISTNENDLWDIAVFAKSIATVLSIDHSLSWSLELKERAKSVLQQCLQISADFSGSLEDAEICSRAELTHTSKKRRISLTKPVAYFQEKTVNREFVNFFHLKELGFSKLFECPSFITYIKYIMFSYFFSQSCCFLYPNFNPPLHSSWRTSFSSFLESFDIVTEQNVILFYRCHTVFYCNNEDYQYTLEQLDILLLKMMRSEEALHCFPLSTPSNLVSLKLLMNFTRVILEEIKQRFRPCLEGNVIVDILHFLEFIGSKFLSSHGHCFLDTFYKIWVLAGVVIHKFKREELIEIFLHCFQFLWKRLSEGAFYSHRLCMHSIIEYACQFEKSVSDFILLSTIDSISKSARSQDRFLTFSYLVSKCSIQCLARCCSAICSGASLMELKVLKHFLQKISMDNGYCNLHDLFSQHSWCILRSWLEHEDGELLEFPFHLFDWSLGSFQHSFPAEFYLLKETDRAIFQKSSLISSNASEQELFVALLDSNLFQCSAISKNNISVHSSDKFDLLFRHILQDDFDGFLAFHLNWMRREYGLFVNAFSAFSILELRIFLSRPKIEVKVFFQLISMLDRCCCERNQADSLFSCMLLWLVILLHLNEEHLMTNELMKLMEKILNRLRDHVSVLKVEDSLLQEMFSCLLIRLNFLGLKSIGFCKIACQFLKGLPSNIMLQLEPPATLPNSLPNEAMCLYHKTLFCAYPTLEMQLDFFVRVCTRRALLGPFVVVARLQLLQEILARNREKIAETGKLEDWLPFISYDDLIPFDRTDIYDIAERCLLYLFQSFMYPVGITCFESAYVFQVPSLLSFTDWSQVVETIIQISFSKFLSCEEEPSWTAAFCALCRLFNDRRTHNYMKNTSYFSSLFNQEIFHLLQARNNMTTVEDSLNSSHFEWLLKNNFRMDESLWLRQLTCCLLHNSCIDSSILIHLRELCLVSLEISVFLFPLILMEIYLSGNIDEWHRIRDGLIVTLSDRAFSSRLTVVLIESLDFVRFQCMSMNGLYADRLDQERHLDNINIFSDSSLLQAVADAAIRVKKYSTAFFYNELVLDGRCVVSHFLETADEANLYVRHKATLQNLVESALGLSDSDLVDAFPMITSSFDLFDSQHVYSLATLAERNCQYELTLRYLDQFLIATEKFSHQCEPKLQRTALSNLPSVLARCGLHYLSDCIDKNALSFSNFLCQSDCSSTKISLKNDVNVFSNAVRDLTEWSAFASETFHPQSYTSDEAFSDQPQCIIPEALRIWHLLEEVCFESSRHISQVVARLRIISYREKEEQDLFSEVERLCLYEDCVHVELDDETIRQLCVVNLERKQFAKVAICERRGFL